MKIALVVLVVTLLALAWRLNSTNATLVRQAVQWLRKAAEQGYAESQFNLGVAYFDGRGVPQDATQAVQWLRKAAEQGEAAAQFNLGYAYTTGRGVPQDFVEASAGLEGSVRAAEEVARQARTLRRVVC